MPNTTEGKARSRMNAMKHGLRATDELFLIHLKPRERMAFDQIRDSLHTRYNPQTDPEEELVDRLAIQHFRLYRLYDVENQAFSENDDKLASNLDRFARYDWRIDRQLRILHNRLRSLYISRGDISLNFLSSRE